MEKASSVSVVCGTIVSVTGRHFTSEMFSKLFSTKILVDIFVNITASPIVLFVSVSIYRKQTKMEGGRAALTDESVVRPAGERH